MSAPIKPASFGRGTVVPENKKIIQDQLNRANDTAFKVQVFGQETDVFLNEVATRDLYRQGKLIGNGKEINATEITDEKGKAQKIFSSILGECGGELRQAKGIMHIIQQDSRSSGGHQLRQEKGMQETHISTEVDNVTAFSINQEKGTFRVEQDGLHSFVPVDDVFNTSKKRYCKMKMIVEGKLSELSTGNADTMRVEYKYTKTYASEKEARKADYSRFVCTNEDDKTWIE